MIGQVVGPRVHQVDERWTMAFAAALGDHLDCCLDTARPDGIVAHPLFPVCPEWPVIVDWRETSDQFGITPEEVSRGIHATHDLTIHRLVRPGDQLSTTMTITGVQQRKPGAYATVRLETVDEQARPVATTVQGMLYLGVQVDGPVAATEPQMEPLTALLPAVSDTSSVVEIPIRLDRGAAHTYTECARIWNPIHTSVAAAHAAGLPGIILHGTATLAHAVSAVVETYADQDPRAVRRIVGRFGAMVPLPSTITVRLFEPVDVGDGTRVVRFDVRTEDGAPAIDRAAIILE